MTTMKRLQVSAKELEEILAEMSPKSTLFTAIKREMQKRGHWRNLNRGSRPPQKWRFTRVSMPVAEKPRTDVFEGDWQ